MTGLAWVLLAGTGLVAAVDWVAVAGQHQRTRYLAKPGALVLLIGAALALQPADAAVRTWLVVGLLFSLAGDVCLLFPKDRFFLAGLVSFLLGHLAYVVGLAQDLRSPLWLVVGAGVVLLGNATVGHRLRRAVKTGPDRAMAAPVTAYMSVISAMVVAAFGYAAAATVAGALLFYASDATLAWNRFVQRRRWGGLTVIVTYHLGQAGLVVGLTR